VKTGLALAQGTAIEFNGITCMSSSDFLRPHKIYKSSDVMRFFSLHFTTTHNVQQQNNFIPKLAVTFSRVMNSNFDK
jgi:hypothetical protein